MQNQSNQFREFGDRAIRVIALAVEEAVFLRHQQVGTEHVLLGLLRDGVGFGARLLTSQGITLIALRLVVQELFGLGESGEPLEPNPSLSDHTENLISVASKRASEMGVPVDTRHLLFGALQVLDGFGLKALISLEVSREKLLENLFQDSGVEAPVNLLALSSDGNCLWQEVIIILPGGKRIRTFKQFADFIRSVARDDKLDILGTSELLSLLGEFLIRNHPRLVSEHRAHRLSQENL